MEAAALETAVHLDIDPARSVTMTLFLITSVFDLEKKMKREREEKRRQMNYTRRSKVGAHLLPWQLGSRVISFATPAFRSSRQASRGETDRNGYQAAQERCEE